MRSRDTESAGGPPFPHTVAGAIVRRDMTTQPRPITIASTAQSGSGGARLPSKGRSGGMTYGSQAVSSGATTRSWRIGSDHAAALLLTGLAVIAVLTFRDYAISNDEEVQHRYGELIIAYYASGLTDDTLFHYKNLYLYGGLFDIIAVLLAKAFAVDAYDLRHLLSALAGIGGIAATWATARLIAGPRAGLLAAAVLAVTGIWYGAMFNHTKDIPLAAAMMAALYFLLRAGRAFPRPALIDVLLFGLMLGIALGLRATALLVVGYAGLLILLRAAEAETLSWGGRARFVLRSGARLVPAFVLAYVIMIAAWPWGALAPFNPVRAIFAFAHFHYPIGTFAAGELYDMATVPRWYVPLYLAIKLPLVLFAGVILAIVFTAWSSSARSRDRRIRDHELGLLIFAATFPVAAHVITHSPAFTGMRHITFIVPPLAALAGFGFDALLRQTAPRRILGLATAGALVAAFAWNASLLVRLHPHQYLFFNPLVGGLEGATRRYDTDYWVNIMPEAVEGLEQFLTRTERARRHPYTVAVCGERLSFEHEADARLEWTPDWKRADFFIAPTHGNCDRVLKGRTVESIERLGVQIGVIKDLRGVPAEERGFPPEVAHSK